MTSWRTGRLVVLVVCVAVGAGVPAWSQARVAARYAVTAEDLAAGRAALDSLAVRGRAPSTGYERERFGQAWADVDRNGCDTRNDVLRRDLTATVVEDCVVLSGTLDDPYTGVPIPFARGPGSADVQIDHVVALSDAWQKGAQAWTAAAARGVRQRPGQPARRRRSRQPGEGRRRRGHLAAAAARVPLRLRAAAGPREGGVRAVGHGRRARRAGAELGRCVVGTARRRRAVC